MNYPIIYLPSDSQNLHFSISTSKKYQKTGASELVAFSKVLELGIKCIRKDVSVVIDGHRFEPDLAYIDKKNGVYVDIEIDEPYTGLNQPTHYVTKNGIHKDTQRNELFRKAGWYVIRFSEKQMFCETKSCMKILYDTLANANAIDSLPSSLLNSKMLNYENCWTYEDSKRMSHKHFRKTYLGFDPMKMDLKGYLRCCILLFPIILQSIKNKQLRVEIIKQVRYFFHI